jgi:uncharacterized protein YcbX
MEIIGTVETLWRYPVKSMRGEQLDEAFVGFAGIYGDRMYAIHSTGQPDVFRWLTAREQDLLLRAQPAFRSSQAMRRPPNIEKAEITGPGITPFYPLPEDTAVDVTLPGGEKFALDDPTLLARLSAGLDARHQLTLQRSDRSMTDCRPVSLFGIWTARQLSQETGVQLDLQRFRANIYADFTSQRGFAPPQSAFFEDELVGRTVRIGARATIHITSRDPRCKMITLDPETAQPNPDIIRCVTERHQGCAGVYAVTLIEGAIRPGDPINLLE